MHRKAAFQLPGRTLELLPATKPLAKAVSGALLETIGHIIARLDSASILTTTRGYLTAQHVNRESHDITISTPLMISASSESRLHLRSDDEVMSHTSQSQRQTQTLQLAFQHRSKGRSLAMRPKKKLQQKMRGELVKVVPPKRVRPQALHLLHLRTHEVRTSSHDRGERGEIEETIPRIHTIGPVLTSGKSSDFSEMQLEKEPSGSR